jgi:predicted transcriptional regulator
MNSLHDQIKKRRKELGFNQEDMANLIGMARQQYQRLESKGNPRLDTYRVILVAFKLLSNKKVAIMVLEGNVSQKQCICCTRVDQGMGT